MTFANNEKEQCLSTLVWPDSDDVYRCQRIAGHTGKHYNRGTDDKPCAVGWTDGVEGAGT